MNPRTTGLLLLVAAALGVFVWLYEIRGGEKRREAEQAAKRLFSAVQAEQVKSIVLETNDDHMARLERADSGWRMKEPIDFPGDPVAIDGIASGLAQLESKSIIEDPQPPKVYGLGEGAKVVRFETDGTEYQLRIGSPTPLGAETYVTTAHDSRIFTVESYKINGMSRSLDDLRERRPLRFDRENLERVEVSWPKGGVVLEKQAGAWRLVEPLEAAADETTLDTFLSDLTFLRASGFIDEPPPDEKLGLDHPAFRVVLTLAAAETDGPPRRAELTIGGKPLDDNARAARSSERTLYKISQSRLDAFPQRVAAYRFKELSRFVASDARRLELAFDDLEAAKQGESRVVTVTAERGDAGWSSSPETMAPGKAARIVSELAQLRAEDIAADSMSGKELEQVGLEPPRAVLRVFGATPEQGDAPKLAEVQLGVIDTERGIYAQTPERETVYLLDDNVAELIPVSLEAFRNRFLSKEQPSDTEQEKSPAPPPP